VTADRCGEAYATGSLAHMGELNDLARYSLIIGYVELLGGRPEILDVGCGPGLLRARLERVPFARYVGIDPVEDVIRRAARLAASAPSSWSAIPSRPSSARSTSSSRTKFYTGVPEPFALAGTGPT
jgi:SAM-dependent methyltransferase